MDAASFVRVISVLAKLCFGQVFRTVHSPLVGNGFGGIDDLDGVVRSALKLVEQIANTPSSVDCRPRLDSILARNSDFAILGGGACLSTGCTSINGIVSFRRLSSFCSFVWEIFRNC